MKKILIALAAAAVLSAGWYLGSPLLIDEVVEEDFPAPSQVDLQMLETLTEDDVAAMSAEQRATVKTMMEKASTAMPDKAVEEPMMNDDVVAEPVLRASGQFRDADSFHKGSGTASVYVLPDGSNLLRFEDFSVTNGPALSVYLVKDSDGDVDSGFVDLGKLKGNKGNQNYAIPEGTNLDEYNSVVIWCVPFVVLFAVATL